MTERDSPKKELILTLDSAWKLITDTTEPPGVRLAMLRGLVDHARALALRVGETSRVRAPKTGTIAAWTLDTDTGRIEPPTPEQPDIGALSAMGRSVTEGGGA